MDNDERADLLALADRVEREEPNTRLDGWIAEMFFNGNHIPPYTTSLDAAASLVPSTAVWLRKSEKTMTVAFYGRGEEWGIHIDATGHTPAAALTAAALRAMAQEIDDGR